jgi:L-amino acid N-acyltransferase YncA
MVGKETRLSRTYPRDVELNEGSVTFRLMTPADRDAVLAFAQELPPDDLLFLRLDVTKPESVDEWVRNIEAGRTITVLAQDEEGLAGYASMHSNDVLWTRHVGELRVLVGAGYRRRGLGRRLTEEVFAISRDLGLRKLTAQMTPDQTGARVTFERLGFRPEALFADFVQDRDGNTRDLLVMSHDISGFTDVQHVERRKAKAS